MTKTRVCKVAGQKGSRESHNILLGVWESVREWTLTPPRGSTLGVGVPVDSWIFWRRFRGQNSMVWSVPYIIGNLLERRCLKWACITHLDVWNTSYGQKKGWESNWQFDSWPLKVKNRPDFFTCRWRETYCWKALDEGYNFVLDLISIEGLQAKLWRLKVVGVPTLAISGLPLGNPGTKSHLDVSPMKRCKVCYKGEGGGFPQVQAVVSRPWWVLWVRIVHSSS